MWLPDIGILLTQDAAIARAASVAGASHLTPVDVPASAEFFLPFFLFLRLSLLILPPALTGRLVQFFKTRLEVRLFD